MINIIFIKNAFVRKVLEVTKLQCFKDSKYLIILLIMLA